MEKINTYIIPVLNNYDGLVKLLISLKKYTPDNYNVIVIHNGNYLKKNPGELAQIERAKPMVNLWIDPYRNLGFGKAMNTGIKLADTEFVTLANDDVEIIYEGWWDEIMTYFKEDANLGGFNPHSPCNKAADGERYIQYPHQEEYTEEQIKEMKEIFHSEKEYTGCCTYFTICRKQMFDEIGLFDESFGMGSGEDYDLCVRAGREPSDPSKRRWYIKGGSKTMVWHWWGNTKDNMPKSEAGGISNYDLIAGGNQNMERKWGKHIDKDSNGWSVSGQGGPNIPLDNNTSNYETFGKWFQEVNL